MHCYILFVLSCITDRTFALVLNHVCCPLCVGNICMKSLKMYCKSISRGFPPLLVPVIDRDGLDIIYYGICRQNLQ